MTNYNPFTEDGNYNLKTLIASNKTLILIVLVIALVLVLLIIYMLYSTDKGPAPPAAPHSSLPDPITGYGPFGYGTYLPSKEAIQAAMYS